MMTQDTHAKLEALKLDLIAQREGWTNWAEFDAAGRISVRQARLIAHSQQGRFARKAARKQAKRATRTAI